MHASNRPVKLSKTPRIVLDNGKPRGNRAYRRCTDYSVRLNAVTAFVVASGLDVRPSDLIKSIDRDLRERTIGLPIPPVPGDGPEPMGPVKLTPILSARDVADRLGISVRRVQERCKRGDFAGATKDARNGWQIPATSIGGAKCE